MSELNTDNCWICRRAKSDLEANGIALIEWTTSKSRLDQDHVGLAASVEVCQVCANLIVQAPLIPDKPGAPSFREDPCPEGETHP
jgi:hypothetical protein